MMSHSVLKNLFSSTLIISALALVGCGSDDFKDLQTYMDEVRARPVPGVAPLPEVTPYEAFGYKDADLRDPFTAIIRMPPQADNTLINQLIPKTDRDKEALERFPLDTIKMVGSLEKNKNRWAIVQDTDGILYRVKRGNHIGKNFGKITKITNRQLEIAEIVPDGVGGWIERQAILKISE